MRRRIICAILLIACVWALPARAQTAALEKPAITLAVGGKTLVAYLPLTIAERRGYFKEQGLNVEISDFQVHMADSCAGHDGWILRHAVLRFARSM